jgi:integrase
MAKQSTKRAGQIIKRGESTWLVRIFTGRDTRGKRSYLNKTIRGTKKNAQSYLTDTLATMNKGTFVAPSPLTVDEYLDQWLQDAARGRVRERTFTDYSEILKRYVRPALGRKKLSNLRPLDIQIVYTKMLDRGLSSRTVRYTHAVLTSALKQAVKWLMLAQNPAALVDLPKLSRSEMKALTAQDAARFLVAAASDRWFVLFAVALATGMRPEEYLALQWKDVNFDKGIVTVQRALVWLTKGRGWIFTEPKTPKSRRNIPLPTTIVRLLKSHRRLQNEERLKAGRDYQANDLVFATTEGGPLIRRNLLRRHFRPILKKAGLQESIRLYDLRHTCATLLLAANEHPKIVSERLGHANITLTLDTYSHVLPSMQRAASEKLERILFKRKKSA